MNAKYIKDFLYNDRFYDFNNGNEIKNELYHELLKSLNVKHLSNLENQYINGYVYKSQSVYGATFYIFEGFKTEEDILIVYNNFINNINKGE